MSESTIVALGILLLLVCAASAQMKDECWERIPANVKVQFAVLDYNDRPFAPVQAFWMTPEIASGAFGATVDWFRICADAQNVFGGRELLCVWVAPVRAGYFWPSDLAFVQGRIQYRVGFTDYFKANGPFSGHLLANTVTTGIVAIPAGIDITKPFLLYYNDDVKGEMGPFTPGT